MGTVRELYFDGKVDSSLIAAFNAHEEVEYAERVPRYRFFYTPNDLLGNQWHLPQIDAENAWDIQQGVDSISVAIIDDAVLLSHQDLSGAIHTNTDEIPGNGVDDDGNGYVDDVNGWDAADNDNDPNPPGYATNSVFTHGTHVAGIAAASTDNNNGVASIGFDVEMIPVKIADDANGSLVAGLQGIEYAIAAGADVINMSWGGYSYSQTYQNLIDVAHNQGIVCVAAAGNDNTNQYMYPASYVNVISVGATDQSDQKASFSNYGNMVDVMAPGVDIYSSLAGNDSAYGNMSGTSMASPLVAGLAGLMLSENPYLDPDTLEQCMEDACVDISAQNPGYTGELGAGRIDAYESLTCVDPIYAKFKSDLKRVCPGDSVQFFDQSTNNPDTWEWSFPGGNPSSSAQQNPVVTYPTNGTYDVKLVVSNSLGTDSVTYTDHITVGPPSGTMSGSATIVYGNSAFLKVDLVGNPPWDITYTDGTDTFSVNNIGSSPYYLGVSPDSTTTYELLEVEDAHCTGSGSGSPTVEVIFGCDVGGEAFQKHFGDNGIPEVAHSVAEAPNKDLLIAGYHEENWDKDLFVARYDSVGNLKWSKTFGDSDDDWGRKVSIVHDGDGDFFVGGRTHSYSSSNRDLILLKLEGNGNLIWEKYYGGSGHDDSRDLAATEDGGVVSIGSTTSSFNQGGSTDALLVKFDANGNVEWNKTYGQGAADHSTAIEPLADKGYIIGFHQRSYGSGTQSTAITRVDSAGSIVWEKYFSASLTQAILGLTITEDSNIVAVGQWQGVFGGRDVLVMKFDLDGTLLWEKVYGGPDTERGHDVVVDQEKNIYVSGSTQSFGNGEQAFLLKLDSVGTQKWTRHFGLNGDEENVRYGGGMMRTSNDEIALVGSTTSPTGEQQGYFIKTDACKNVGCMQSDTIFSEVDTNLTEGTTDWLIGSGGSLNNTSLNVGSFSAGMDTLCEYESPVIECALEADFVADTVCIGDSTHFTDQSYDYKGNNIISWEWRFGDGDTLTGVQDPTHVYPSADTFQVELIVGSSTDSSKVCYDTVSKPVMVLDTLTAFLPGPDTICEGDSLSIGPPQLVCGAPPYEYTWTPTAGLSNDSVGAPIASPDTTRTYKVLVEDSLGFVTEDSIKVVVDTTCCVSHASFDGDSVYCLNDSVLFQNTSLVNGSGATYQWDFGPNATPSSYTGPNPPPVVYDTTGIHDVTLLLTDSCGMDTAEGSVSILPLPIVDAGGDTTACIGDSVRLGETPLAWHQYDWWPSAGLSDTAIADPKASVDTPITYYMKGTNTQTGCSRVDTVHIDTLSAPNAADLGPDSTLCQGDSLLLEASDYPVSVPLWQDGSTDSVHWADSTGTYWVVDSNKCGTSSDTVSLEFLSPPDPDLGNDTSICLHASLLLDATHPNSSYQWQDGSTDSTYLVDTAGTYWVEVSNSVCPPTSDTIEVANIPYPEVDLGNDTNVCYPDTLLLDASFSGGSYQWQDGSTDSIYAVDTSGTYWVEVSNACGAEIDSLEVTMEMSPMPDLGPDSTLCPEETVLLDATHPGASYQWQDGSADSTFLVDEEGTYWVEVTVPPCPGVRDSIEFTPIVPPAPRLGPDTTICESEPLEFTIRSGPPDTVLWQDGTRAVSYEVDEEGSYSVYASNRCGSGTDTLEVETEDCSCDYTVPNVFTPNGDGKNDRFRIRSENCEVKGLRIYNRWGQTLYRQQAPDPEWDGRTVSGKAVSEGTYFFKVRIDEEQVTGSLTLMRSE